jgi:peptidoglycan DL-endopeptidase CwlO
MGSHRARHRADQHQSEELATDLLARLAGETRPRPTRTRHAPERPALDPFSTAPFPAHPPQGAEASDTGSARIQPTEVADHPGPAADGNDDGTNSGADDGSDDISDHRADFTAGRIPTPRFPADPRAPFPLDAPAAHRARFPRTDALPDAPRTAGGRLAALNRKPIYAAVSATVLTATATAAAMTGPVTITPPTPTADTTSSPALAAAAAIDLGQNTARSPAPVARQVAGGVAVLAPGQGTANTPDDSPALGSGIAARAAADAKAYADKARQAANSVPKNLPRNLPNPVPKPAPKAAPKAAPRPAAAPAAAAPVGSSASARALGLAKSKLGKPYVWGAAGPNAFDCSGLIVWAYKQLGVSLPHSSATLSSMGTPVSKAALQPGDLVFFYSPVSHVGIYAGNGMVLNATQSGEPVQYSKLANLPFHNAVRINK